jgi:hypothetical protein
LYINNQLSPTPKCVLSAKDSDKAKLNLSGNYLAISAQACIANAWLDETDDPDTAIVVLGHNMPSDVAGAYVNAVREQTRIASGDAITPNLKTTLIISDDPSWTCQQLESLTQNSSDWENIKTSTWAGCLKDPPSAPHSWNGFDPNNCTVSGTLVNYPGMIYEGPRAGERYIVFSRCTSEITNYSANMLPEIIRKKTQSDFFCLICGNLKRYWFESGLQYSLAGYVDSINKNAIFTPHGISLSKAIGRDLANDSETATWVKKKGSIGSVTILDSLESAQVPQKLRETFSLLAAEYILGKYGLTNTYDLIKVWQTSTSVENRANVTKQVLGISEVIMFAEIDAYIAQTISNTR